jgi:uncharacterized coiled-coil protein SlyX
MKKLITLAGLFSVLGCFLTPAAAAEQEQIIIDDLSLAELREQIERVQAEFYRVFNDINEDDNFDIICHRYLPTGSNISRDACEPQFVIDKRADNVTQSRFGNDTLMDHGALMASLQPQFEELTRKMNAVAAENQYFSELNQVLGMLNDRLREITN